MGAGGGGRLRADRHKSPDHQDEQAGDDPPPIAVEAVVDGLVEGTVTLAEAVRDFSGRSWPATSKTSADSWAAVQDDPRLTAEQYQVLGAAYRRAVGR
jgi:hypothetical protein